MTSTENPPENKRGPEWRRRLRVARWRGIREIKHNDVVEHVADEGVLTGRYIFMTVMACGIAILGLLLSSPAVIIGAMLISPLMGPIMLMGFSLAILDLAALRQSVISLAIGTAVALGTSFLIVLISPLTENTSEILARARPNFFDLLVAVFSGLAGGYAVIHRKGETIVGVAIAAVVFLPTAAAAKSFNESSPGYVRASAVAAELAKGRITAAFAGELRATGNTPADRETAARRTNQVLIRPAG